MSKPSCSRTALSILFFRFFLKLIPFPSQSTLLLNITSAVLMILKTASDGKRSPPFCLKEVNFASGGYEDISSPCGFSGSSKTAGLASATLQ